MPAVSRSSVPRKYTGDMILEFPMNYAQFIQTFSHTHLSSAVVAKISAKTSQDFLTELTKIAAELGENKAKVPR
jgi:hypothetical protein